MIVVTPAVLPAPNDQADSSSLTFFLQQTLLLEDSLNQLFRLRREQGIGAQTSRDRVFSLKKIPSYGDLLHRVVLVGWTESLEQARH